MRLTNHVLAEYYRCPDYLRDFMLAGNLREGRGYFRFGRSTICYGTLSSGRTAETAVDGLHDALEGIGANGTRTQLPFEASELIENLRRERYAAGFHGDGQALTEALRKAYYFVRPILPVPVRKSLQKIHLRGWDKIRFPAWPVDTTVERLHQ